MSFKLETPQERLQKIAGRAKDKRLSYNFSQRTLSQRSGVSYGVLKKFEQTGQISLESLLNLAVSLDAMQDFEGLFKPHSPEEALSLDDLIKQGSRQRGRK